MWSSQFPPLFFLSAAEEEIEVSDCGVLWEYMRAAVAQVCIGYEALIFLKVRQPIRQHS